MNKYIVLTLLALGLFSATSQAQTTGSAFSYQGELLDNGSPANADYDFGVDLYMTETGGTAITTDTHNDVSVENGLFNLEIDFGDVVYEDSDQYYIELRVTPSAGGATVALAPRTKLLSVPYATQALFGTSPWDVDGTTIYTLGKVGIGLDDPSDRLQIRAIAADEGAFRVQIDNNTKLRVQANGGASIGVNNPPATPANGLYVSGDVKQNAVSNGMLKFMIQATCVPTPTIERQYNGTSTVGTATIIRAGLGRCNFEMPFDVSNNYVSVSPTYDFSFENATGSCVAGGTLIVCNFEEPATGVNADVSFALLVY